MQRYLLDASVKNTNWDKHYGTFMFSFLRCEMGKFIVNTSGTRFGPKAEHLKISFLERVKASVNNVLTMAR